MKIKCILTEISGKTTEWENISSLYINRSRSSPADYMEVAGFFEGAGQKFSRVQVQIDGAKAFEGMVDKQRFTLNERGSVLLIECRSDGAKLLDNEAQPKDYYSVNAQDIFNTHIRPYGFTQARALSSQTMSSFKVTNGLSEWDVYAIFCQRLAGTTPFIKRNGTVAVDLTNEYYNLTDAPLLSLEVNYEPCNAISHIYVRDNRGYYSTRVDNEYLPDSRIIRRHFILPNSQYAGRVHSDTYTRINRSMARTYSQKAEFAGFIPLELGAQLALRHPMADSSLDHIKEFSYSYDGGGMRTAVTTIDRKFR